MIEVYKIMHNYYDSNTTGTLVERSVLEMTRSHGMKLNKKYSRTKNI
jgi:hypothetical protein